MRTVTVQYTPDGGYGWIAESPDAPEYLAFAKTFEEVRRLAHEGLRLFINEPIAIYDPTLTADNRATGDRRPGKPAPSRRIAVPNTFPTGRPACRNAA